MMISNRDDLSDEGAHAILKDDNEARIFAIKERTNGQVTLEGAFDSLRATTYLKHLALDAGILDRADFDFEGQRAKQLDQIEKDLTQQEKEWEKQRAAAEHAQNMARLQGIQSNGVRGHVPPGGQVLPISRPTK